jgi:SAM-dependent methyltransferase
VTTEVTNEQYWNEHAADYDQLYMSRWCQLEDERISAWLSAIVLPSVPTILDVGCGTGLALRQLSSAGIVCRYNGFDISPEMIRRFNAGHSTALSVRLMVADLATFEWPGHSRLDLITSIFGSMSFCEQRWVGLQRLANAQIKGDKIFLMALGRYSLRKILRGDFRDRGLYRTRSSKSDSAVRVFYDRRRDIVHHLENMGYRIVSLTGDGPACGLWENRLLWKLNHRIGILSPSLSHTIVVLGEKL